MYNFSRVDLSSYAATADTATAAEWQVFNSHRRILWLMAAAEVYLKKVIRKICQNGYFGVATEPPPLKNDSAQHPGLFPNNIL